MGSGPRPTHTYTESGTYNVTLTVVDNDGTTGTSTIVVNVTYNPPHVVLDIPEVFVVDIPVTLTAADSYDVDGSIAEFFWNMGDGTLFRNATLTHAFNRSGEFVIRVMVIDDDGLNALESMVVNVRENADPTSPAALRTYVVYMDSMVNMTAVGIDDPDGDALSYYWSFGDGGTGYGPAVNHTYSSTGRFNVSLNVTDEYGGYTTLSGTVEVRERELDTSEARVAESSLLSTGSAGALGIIVGVVAGGSVAGVVAGKSLLAVLRK